MPQYELAINVVGRDRVSGPLNRIDWALTRVLTTALGFVAARVFEAIAQSVIQLGESAINATAQLQYMEVGLQGLIARDLVNASDGVKSIADVFPQATMEAKKMMDELAKMAILSPYMLQDVNYAYKMAMAFGFAHDEAKDFTSGILNVAAGIGADNSMLQRMAYNLAQVRQQGKVTALDIRQLAQAGFDLRAVLKYVAKQFGYNIKDHLEFNKLVEEGKIQWKDFAKYFNEYATTMFGGASERMSRTLMGLKSTLNDVFVLTMPKVIGPAIEEVVALLNQGLNIFLQLRDSGVLEEWGKSIQASVKNFLGPWTVFLGYITEYLDLVNETALVKGMGKAFREDAVGAQAAVDAYGGIFQVIRQAIEKAFGPEALAKFDMIIGVIQKVRTVFGELKQGDVLGALKEIGVPQGVLDFLSKLGVALSNVGTFITTYGPQILATLGQLFGGLAAKGADEAGPKIQSFGDTLVDLSKKLVENGPSMVEGLQKFVDWVFEEGLPKLKETWTWLKEEAIPGIQDFGKNLRDTAAIVLPVIMAILGTIGAIAASGAVAGAISAITSFVNVIGLLMALSGGVGPFLAILGTTLAGIVGPALAAAAPILLVAAAIGTLIYAVITNWDKVSLFFTGIWNSIVTTLQPAIQGLVAAIQPLIDKMGGASAIGNFLLEVLKWIGIALAVILGGAISIVTSLIVGLINGISTGITWFITLFQSVLQMAQTFVAGIVGFFTGLWELLQGMAQNNTQMITEGFNKMVTGILQIVTGFFGTIITFFASSFAAIIGLVWGFVLGVVNFFINLYNQLVGKSIIPDMMKGIYDSIVTWFNKAIEFVRGIVATFVQVGKDIFSGLKEGAIDAWNRFLGWFQGVINLLPATVKKILGIGSPSKVFQQFGKNMMQGMQLGINAYRYMPMQALSAVGVGVANGQPGVNVEQTFYAGNQLDAELVARRSAEMVLERIG